VKQLKKGTRAYLVDFYRGKFRALAEVTITTPGRTYSGVISNVIHYDNIYDMVTGMPTGINWRNSHLYLDIGKVPSKNKVKMIKAIFTEPEYIGGTK
jgi:hypothetical protein